MEAHHHDDRHLLEVVGLPAHRGDATLRGRVAGLLRLEPTTDGQRLAVQPGELVLDLCVAHDDELPLLLVRAGRSACGELDAAEHDLVVDGVGQQPADRPLGPHRLGQWHREAGVEVTDVDLEAAGRRRRGGRGHRAQRLASTERHDLADRVVGPAGERVGVGAADGVREHERAELGQPEVLGHRLGDRPEVRWW